MSRSTASRSSRSATASACPSSSSTGWRLRPTPSSPGRSGGRSRPHKVPPIRRLRNSCDTANAALVRSLVTGTNSPGRIPLAERLTVGVAARLSRYLQVLTQAKKMGKDRISSQEIADYTNINATQIRRDLSNFGKFGKRGVGYSIDSLLEEIRKILRTQGQHNIALVGAGHLGKAIAGSSIFGEHGITIAAVFDTDEQKIGQPIGDVEVTDYARVKDVIRDKNIVVGVLAVPAEAAQDVADDLIDAGVRIIFNYSEALLDVPGDVTVHTSNPAVDLLHALYFHLS